MDKEIEMTSKSKDAAAQRKLNKDAALLKQLQQEALALVRKTAPPRAAQKAAQRNKQQLKEAEAVAEELLEQERRDRVDADMDRDFGKRNFDAEKDIEERKKKEEKRIAAELNIIAKQIEARNIASIPSKKKSHIPSAMKRGGKRKTKKRKGGKKKRKTRKKKLNKRKTRRKLYKKKKSSRKTKRRR